MSQRNDFTISNIAGGNERAFRMSAGGDMSAASIRYARNIGYGGPSFGGAAAAAAREQWERIEDARLDGDDD